MGLLIYKQTEGHGLINNLTNFSFKFLKFNNSVLYTSIIQAMYLQDESNFYLLQRKPMYKLNIK